MYLIPTGDENAPTPENMLESTNHGEAVLGILWYLPVLS